MLVLVANRLPVVLHKEAKALAFERTTGGLASGLGAFYQEKRAVWIGWPGDIPPAQQASVEERFSSESRCRPVFLPTRLARRYYSGFSNRTLWPLFHSFPTYARYSPRDWKAYRDVNEIFCEKILEVTDPSDLIWIHDYHLLLLPRMLRERRPASRIGFFLHIPFPDYGILRCLPWHREIVEGILGADLVGFHTYDYAQTFLGSVRRLFGIDNEVGQLLMGNRVVQVDVFPMGVDFARFANATESSAVRRLQERFRRRVGRSKLVFSISRLDYTKGIPEQLKAIGSFLERHPEWRGKLVYLCVVVPSREIVDKYASLKREIDEVVGRINSRHAGIGQIPVWYTYRRLSDDELVALYSVGDVALVTPLRDGMNLVAKEFLATRTDGKGVLILSEMAGAAKELLEAVIVNPYDREAIAGAIQEALLMPEEEQIRRNRIMRARLEDHDVRSWATLFVDRFEEAIRRSRSLGVRMLTPRDEATLSRTYRESSRRLLLLDYDGSLVAFADHPTEATPSDRVLETLKTFASDPRNFVCLVSGRPRADLERWFGHLPVVLVGEHGGWVRWRPGKAWERVAVPDGRWKRKIRGVLQRFVDRVPGSFVEEKDYSLAWHYRRAATETGVEAARELIDTLTALTANLDISVVPGNKVVEVRSGRVGKGKFFATRLADKDWDFLLAAGDDTTDEQLFAALPADSISIKVGLAPSAGRFNVRSPEDLLSLLGRLARGAGPAPAEAGAAPRGGKGAL